MTDFLEIHEIHPPGVPASTIVVTPEANIGISGPGLLCGSRGNRHGCVQVYQAWCYVQAAHIGHPLSPPLPGCCSQPDDLLTLGMADVTRSINIVEGTDDMPP